MVKGYAKHRRYMVGDDIEKIGINQWNILRLDGKWYLCDPNFGSHYQPITEKKWRTINRFDRENERVNESKVYGFNKTYFITNPEEFIYNHFPINPKYQLLARKVTLEEYGAMVYAKVNFFRAKLRIVTHPRCIFPADHSRNEIVLERLQISLLIFLINSI